VLKYFIIFILILFIPKALFPQGISLGVYPPLIKPEREYNYLQESLTNFLIDRARLYGGYSAEVVTSPDTGKNFEHLLKSNFIFDKKGRARVELALLDGKTGKIRGRHVREIEVKNFWEELDKELRGLFEKKDSYTKVETFSEGHPKESLFSRLNPFKGISRGISKLLPKNEDPLRLKLNVPPPPPPSVISQSSPSFIESPSYPLLAFPPQQTQQTQQTQQEVLPQPKEPLPPPSPSSSSQKSSPWQWF